MNAHTQNEGSVADIEDMTVDAAQIEPLTADSETESPVEPRANRFRAGDWSNTRALIVGGIFGALVGAVFFGGYAAASAWICSANLNCGHWAPIAIISGIGAVVFTILGAIAGLVLNRMYRLFRVA